MKYEVSFYVERSEYVTVNAESEEEAIEIAKFTSCRRVFDETTTLVEKIDE